MASVGRRLAVARQARRRGPGEDRRRGIDGHADAVNQRINDALGTQDAATCQIRAQARHPRGIVPGRDMIGVSHGKEKLSDGLTTEARQGPPLFKYDGNE